ncbi:MAG: peptide/nickel transport system permease protein [Gammaproteobacteria bacterium]|jgi:peptide/nickel transport system permease protein
MLENNQANTEMSTVEQPNTSPVKDVAQRFARSPISVFALVVLLAIVVMAIIAPLISPQNPYDLGEIDLKDGRLPPGSGKFSKLAESGLEVKLSGFKAGGKILVVTKPIARGKDVAADAISFSVVTDSSDSSSLKISIQPVDEGPMQPLREVRFERMPRGSTLSSGEKDKFRNNWKITQWHDENIVMSLAKPVADSVKFRVMFKGGPQTKIMTYWLGTDDQGRDMLSGIFYGLRISLIVAVASVLIALTIGTILGLIAAYYGGRIDTIIMRLVDLQLSFPTILIALILLAILGKGVFNVMLALVIVQWALYARTARGVALSERRKEYVESAQSLGLGAPRVILTHILPNCMPSLIVIATLEVAHAISLEATLSFLGLGLPITQPSLGLLISNGFDYLLSGYPWISVLPGVALLITVFSINLVGDRLRDILNPRLRR